MFDVYERIGAKVDRQTGEIALLVPKRRFFSAKKINCKLVRIEISQLQLKKLLLYPNNHLFFLLLSCELVGSLNRMLSPIFVKWYGILNIRPLAIN